MTLRTPAWRFLAEMARSRGDFNRMADRVARRDGAVTPDELVAALRAHEQTVWKPPGVSASLRLSQTATRTCVPVPCRLQHVSCGARLHHGIPS